MAKVINILADGTVLDSMEGFVIDLEKNPHIYTVFAEMSKRQKDREKKQ
jgi:hypothetical protein